MARAATPAPKIAITDTVLDIFMSSPPLIPSASVFPEISRRFPDPPFASLAPRRRRDGFQLSAIKYIW
jgi:hypothetical protein